MWFLKSLPRIVIAAIGAATLLGLCLGAGECFLMLARKHGQLTATSGNSAAILMSVLYLVIVAIVAINRFKWYKHGLGLMILFILPPMMTFVYAVWAREQSHSFGWWPLWLASGLLWTLLSIPQARPPVSEQTPKKEGAADV